MNDTVCLTQSTTASFTCVVDTGGIGISSAGWYILVEGTYVPIISRDRHIIDTNRNGNTITDTLTVTNVSVNDSGALYRCEPFGNVISMPVTITTLGEIAICLSCAYNVSYTYHFHTLDERNLPRYISHINLWSGI